MNGLQSLAPHPARTNAYITVLATNKLHATGPLQTQNTPHPVCTFKLNYDVGKCAVWMRVPLYLLALNKAGKRAGMDVGTYAHMVNKISLE